MASSTNSVFVYILFSLAYFHGAWSLTVSQSIPFAPFRMECPKGQGLVELSIRLVASSGGNRKDILYTAACDDLNYMFPIEDSLKPLEREECRWTLPINPLSTTDFDSPCTEREYFAGVSRLASNPRTSFLCCQLRTRQMSNCVEFAYAQPTFVRPLIQFHHTASVFSALRVSKRKLIAMFCELETRSLDDIGFDTTEISPTTIEQTTTAATSMLETERVTTQADVTTASAVTETQAQTHIELHTVPQPVFAPASQRNFSSFEPKTDFKVRDDFPRGPVPMFVPVVPARFPEFPLHYDRSQPQFLQTPDGKLVPFEIPWHPSQPPRHPSQPSQRPSQPPWRPSQPPRRPSQQPRHPSQPSQHPSQPPRRPFQPPRHPIQPPQHPSQQPQRPSQSPRHPSQPPQRPSQPPASRILFGEDSENSHHEDLSTSSSFGDVSTQNLFTAAPHSEMPVTEPLFTEGPYSETPVTEPLFTDGPYSETPVTEPLFTDGPYSETPVTEPLFTEDLHSEMPVTELLFTEYPHSETPVTRPFFTEDPHSETPITEPTMPTLLRIAAQKVAASQQAADDYWNGVIRTTNVGEILTTTLQSVSTVEMTTTNQPTDVVTASESPTISEPPTRRVELTGPPKVSKPDFSNLSTFISSSAPGTVAPDTVGPPGHRIGPQQVGPPGHNGPQQVGPPGHKSGPQQVGPPGQRTGPQQVRSPGHRSGPQKVGPPGHRIGPQEESVFLAPVSRIPNLKTASDVKNQELINDIRNQTNRTVANDLQANSQKTIHHVPVLAAKEDSGVNSVFQGGSGTPPLDAFVFVPGPAPHPDGTKEPLFIELPQIPAVDFDAATGIHFPDEANLPPGQNFLELQKNSVPVFLPGPAPHPDETKVPLFVNLPQIPAIDLDAATGIHFPDEANVAPGQYFLELQKNSVPSVHRFGAIAPPNVRINNYPRSGYNYHGHIPRSRKVGEVPRFFSVENSTNATDLFKDVDVKIRLPAQLEPAHKVSSSGEAPAELEPVDDNVSTAVHVTTESSVPDTTTLEPSTVGAVSTTMHLTTESSVPDTTTLEPSTVGAVSTTVHVTTKSSVQDTTTLEPSTVGALKEDVPIKLPKLLVFDAKLKEPAPPRRILQPDRFFAFTQVEITTEPTKYVTTTIPKYVTTTIPMEASTAASFLHEQKYAAVETEPVTERPYSMHGIHWIAEPALPKLSSKNREHREKFNTDGETENQVPRTLDEHYFREEIYSRKYPPPGSSRRPRPVGNLPLKPLHSRTYHVDDNEPEGYPSRQSRPTYPVRSRQANWQSKQSQVPKTLEEDQVEREEWIEKLQQSEEQDLRNTENQQQEIERSSRRHYRPPSRSDPYRRPPPGNILEFCTKEIAAVDEDGMIIACGLGDDVWEPTHCPEETVCFNARDTTYRICCPVFSGR